MATVGAFEKEQLFNAFVIAIKRPDVFVTERQNAEQWLANEDNKRELRHYREKMSVLLYHEVLPDTIYEILKRFHDDHVGSLTEEQFAEYSERLSPRNILAVLA